MLCNTVRFFAKCDTCGKNIIGMFMQPKTHPSSDIQIIESNPQVDLMAENTTPPSIDLDVENVNQTSYCGGDDNIEMDNLSESDSSSIVSVILCDAEDENDVFAHMHEVRPDQSDHFDDEDYVEIGSFNDEEFEIDDKSENDTSSLISIILCDSDGNENVTNTHDFRPDAVRIEDVDDEDGCYNDVLNDYSSEIQPENEILEEQDLEPQAPSNESLSGRRFVDVKFFFQQIQSKKCHSGSCHFEDMIFETEVKKGLNSMFQFQCGVCGVKRSIWSCKESEPVTVNEAAVLGITSVGLGSYHLNEFCTNMEVPCMSNYMYDKTQKGQQHDWWELAKKHASEALQEEIRLAILNGNVDSSGNALITVICDGSWPKRSYSKNFTSLSGCAVIIGMRTNKVIYFDVKDKYCHVCKIAQNRNSEPRQHDCNTNYKGPASSMETTIVVEGFQHCETLGARFNEFVADGDSSTFKTICDLKVYQNPDVSVEKDDCCNHLYRNFRKAFEGLGKATKKFKLDARKHVTKKKGNDICLGVQTTAKHWRSSNVTVLEKLINLERDVLNAPLHYFGIHDGCDAYYCSKTTEPEAENIVAMLKSDGIFDKILNLCHSYFASSVPSLLLNYNNNMAESFNNLIAKYTGGKRLNYCLAKSYQSRVARSVVQYNTDGCSGSTYHKSKRSSAISLKRLEERRKQKCRKNLLAKKMKPPKARFSELEIDKGSGYGPHCQTNDMSQHLFEIAKNRFMNNLAEDQAKRDFISNSTLGRGLNRKWRELRKNLLTSYYFSQIVNARSPKSYKNIVDDIIYKNLEFSDSAENRHQKIHEKKALDCFGRKYGMNLVSECGLIIDVEHSFLATSPFRLFADNGIIVIKCPVKAYKKSIQEAIDEKLIPLWKNVSGVNTLNEASSWYIEIQGQLHITWKSVAYVVVWLESEFETYKVYRDDDFWNKTMQESLVSFYEQAMIKELVDPRKRRSMPLRAYNPNSKTFE